MRLCKADSMNHGIGVCIESGFQSVLIHRAIRSTTDSYCTGYAFLYTYCWIHFVTTISFHYNDEILYLVKLFKASLRVVFMFILETTPPKLSFQRRIPFKISCRKSWSIHVVALLKTKKNSVFEYNIIPSTLSMSASCCFHVHIWKHATHNIFAAAGFIR